jgi:putative transcriptional regulator
MSERIKSIEETYHSLLMEYASGCLDEARALVVAAHMALSPSARKIVSEYESIGGAMLHDCCPPVAMKPDALKCVMAKLETAVAPTSPCKGKPKLDMSNFHEVPGCLEHYMQHTVWQRRADGYETLHIRTTCAGSTAEMVRVKPGISMEPKTRDQVEFTLLLQGSARDEGRTYSRGDLIIVGEEGTPYLLTDASGAIFFVVRPRTSPLKRAMKTLISYFSR